MDRRELGLPLSFGGKNMKTRGIVSFALFWISQVALAAEMNCEGWVVRPGQEFKRAKLATFFRNSQNWKQQVDFEGYHFSVDWDVNLDCFYTRIEKDGKPVFFSTARVPTFNHNDSFSDVTFPDGLRLAVSCNFN